MTTFSNFQSSASKSLVVFFSLMVVCFSAEAQTDKGTLHFGLHNFSPSGMNVEGIPVNLFGRGSTFGLAWGTSSTVKDGEKSDDGKSLYTLGLNLSSHYFVANNLSVGVVGSFFSSFSAYANESAQDGRYSGRILLAGPEVRYYMGSGNTKAWVKASGSLGAQNVWWDGRKDDPSMLSQVAVGTGVSFFLSRRVSLDVGLEYNVFTMTTHKNTKGINKNVAIDLGFGLYF